MKKIEPYTFGADIGGKPFTVRIEPKGGTLVNGLYDDDYFYSFRRPVRVVKGDVFSAAPGKGLILNGKLVPRAIIKPKEKMPLKITWASKLMRIAVFLERDRLFSKRLKRFSKKLGNSYWAAVDLRSYWLGTGNTPQEAIQGLIRTVQYTEEMAKLDRKKGHRVIRWHCERQPSVQRDLKADEKKARKSGFILEGVDWRKSEFAKKMSLELGTWPKG